MKNLNKYFYYNGKKIMTYTMVKKSPFRFPTERYLNVVKQGYKDCNLNKKFLVKAFQRRFRQSLINGKSDQECLLIAKNLLKS